MKEIKIHIPNLKKSAPYSEIRTTLHFGAAGGGGVVKTALHISNKVYFFK